MESDGRSERESIYRPGRRVVLTLFEIEVVTSLLETALNGWEGDQARQNAAIRAIKKLKGQL